MKEQDAMAYVLEWYERVGEALVGEEELKELTLDELQRLFGVQKTDPMYEMFEVDERRARALQRHVEHTIDLRQHEYFVTSLRL